MSDLLQAVTEARQQRSNAEQSFRAALVRAKEAHSWAEVARAAGVSKSGARWLVRSASAKETLSLDEYDALSKVERKRYESIDEYNVRPDKAWRLR